MADSVYLDNPFGGGGGGGGTPGGSDTQVQYNNAGAFGGITGATTNGTALTLVAPVLGTPASGTLTNCTGLPIAGITGLGTGVATALAANVTGSTGIVLATSPTLVTPVLGVATATSVVASGILQAQDGASGTPGFRFTTDATGFFRQGLHNIGVSGGLLRLSGNGAVNFGAVGAQVGWFTGGAFGTLSVGLASVATAGILDLFGNSTGATLQMREQTPPAAPATDFVRLYVDESGGKTRLMALFATGAAVPVAAEP